MNKRLGLLVACLSIAIVGLSTCSKRSHKGEYGEYVQAQDSFPRIRYFDSNRLSLNTRCAVRKTRLNPRVAPIYVNGQPVGFC